MSFSSCPNTFRQNRRLTSALTPVGSDLAAGRRVARIRITPNAEPILMMNVASSPACLPYFSGRTGSAPRPRCTRSATVSGCAWSRSPGDPFVRAHRTRQRLEPLGAAADLGAEQPQRLGRVHDRLSVRSGSAARVWGPSSEPRGWPSSVACQGRSATGFACGCWRSSESKSAHQRPSGTAWRQPARSRNVTGHWISSAPDPPYARPLGGLPAVGPHRTGITGACIKALPVMARLSVRPCRVRPAAVGAGPLHGDKHGRRPMSAPSPHLAARLQFLPCVPGISGPMGTFAAGSGRWLPPPIG
jgi:hypothetical protein